MTVLAALAEPVLVMLFLAIVLAGTWLVCHRSGLNARWVRRTQPDLTVRRPRESPSEMYLRRQREQATAWQEVNR